MFKAQRRFNLADALAPGVIQIERFDGRPANGGQSFN
jgi:hypothetical protein